MADAPKIVITGQNKDTLRTGAEKINLAIGNSNDARKAANTALTNSENTQTQLDNIVINGDSSVEAAQARIDANGNASETLKDRIDKQQYFLNVKSFGAKGDGVTDDTLAVRKAIDGLIGKGGGVLYFPYSTGYVLRGVIVPSNIKVIGQEANIIQKDIKYTTTTAAIVANEQSMTVADASDIKTGDVLVVKSSATDLVYVTSVNGNQLGIKTFRIHRKKSETHTGFKYAHASGATVSVMTQVFWVTNGFDLESDVLDDTVYQGGVENTSFTGLVFKGSRDSMDTTKRTVYDGTACGAIYFYRTSGTSVTECTFEDFYNSPVMFYGWNNSIKYTKNKTNWVGYIDPTTVSVAERDGTSGVVMHWDQRYTGNSELSQHVSTDFEMSFNSFENCWNGGVFCSGANNGDISHNKVKGFISRGIVVYGGDLGIDVFNVSVLSNSVSNGRVGTDTAASGEGIWVSVVNKGCTVLGNKVRNCESGISIGNSSLVDVIANIIQDCTTNLIKLLYTNKDITFSNNVFAVNFGYADSKTGEYAILLDSSGGSSDNLNIKFMGNTYRFASSYKGSQLVRIVKSNDTSFINEIPNALVNFLSNADTVSPKKPVFNTCDFRGVPGTGMSSTNAIRINTIEPSGKISYAGLPGALEYNFLEVASVRSGTTAARPTGVIVGTMYFDTTLGKPIWYNGSVWKDSAGTTV